jgi:hypothetical protein
MRRSGFVVLVICPLLTLASVTGWSAPTDAHDIYMALKNTRHRRTIDVDGASEGYQSDCVTKLLDQLKAQGEILEGYTRARLRKLIQEKLGWSSSQRQTIDRVLRKHLGK